MVQVDIKYSDPYDHHTANSLTANMRNIGQQPGEVFQLSNQQDRGKCISHICMEDHKQNL